MRPVTDEKELERAFNEPLAIVFKHSTRCPISAAAHQEMSDFRRRHPEVPVYVVHVVEQKGLSRAVSERTGVRHESPQVIVLSGGAVAWSTSHEGITADALEARLA